MDIVQGVRTMAKIYQVCSYDVWGNEEDGYEVNAVYLTDKRIEIDDDTTDEQIADMLGITQKISVDGELGYSLYVEAKDSLYPICELRPWG